MLCSPPWEFPREQTTIGSANRSCIPSSYQHGLEKHFPGAIGKKIQYAPYHLDRTPSRTCEHSSPGKDPCLSRYSLWESRAESEDLEGFALKAVARKFLQADFAELTLAATDYSARREDPNLDSLHLQSMNRDSEAKKGFRVASCDLAEFQ